jgi:hypothetical protein
MWRILWGPSVRALCVVRGGSLTRDSLPSGRFDENFGVAREIRTSAIYLEADRPGACWWSGADTGKASESVSATWALVRQSPHPDPLPQGEGA